jgi:hypothetical protein
MILTMQVASGLVCYIVCYVVMLCCYVVCYAPDVRGTQGAVGVDCVNDHVRQQAGLTCRGLEGDIPDCCQVGEVHVRGLDAVDLHAWCRAGGVLAAFSGAVL